MTLFAGASPAVQSTGPRPRRRVRIGWTLLVVALVGTLVLALIPSPYVIERPGPVFDTLGTVTISGKSTPMIEIPGQKTWATAGSLDMLTVNLAGDRSNLPNWVDVASAWFDPSQAVLPVASVYPPGYSVEDSNKQGAIDMQNSQKDAIAAALRSLGHEVPATVTVEAITKGSLARGVLKNGDTIVRVDDTGVSTIAGLRKAIASRKAGSTLSIDIERDGEPRTVKATSISSSGANPVPILGIGVAINYDFPFDVKIQLENVGGPSAGQMFALGIIDKLTPGSLTGGKHVAGTGTIDERGVIGPIGGIRQKMYGASRAGATIFLAPYGDCDEVVGHIPDGLRVFAVKTLDDSLADLKVIAAGGDTGSLRSCSAG
ncbi:MAG: PDZ domain-containing protein [Lacisediminihabitans sp.]